jgi:hypothetical protein
MNILSRISPNARTPLGCLLILLGIFYAYAQVGGHRFVEFDDGLYAFDNRKLIVGLTWENIVWAFTNVDAVNWHPLTWLSLLVDRELFGPRPGGYLLMNVLWHSIAACLCYVAFKKTTGSQFIGLTIGLVFALHPANVENVAWLSSRKSILDAGFWFLGIIFYIRFLQTKQRLYYLLVFTTHLLGLMCKSMHVTFPCTLWLIHALFHVCHNTEKSDWKAWWSVSRSALIYSAPMLLVSIYFSLVTLAAQSPAMSSLGYMSITDRLINSTLSYDRYLWMFFHPTEFAPFYPLFLQDLTVSNLIVPLITLVSITAACLLAASRHPRFLIGWLWYVGTMVPVIGLVQVGSQSHADRYLYIPGIGLALILVSFFKLIPTSRTYSKWLATIWLAGITLSLAAATKIQAAYWKDGIVLFRHSLAVTGDCVTSVNALSSAYGRQQRYTEGMAFLKEKIDIAKNPINRARFLTQYAGMAMAENKMEEAMKSLEEAIKLGYTEQRPYYMAALVSLELDDIESAEKYHSKLKNLPSTGNLQFSIDSMFLDFGIGNLDTLIQIKKDELSK